MSCSRDDLVVAFQEPLDIRKRMVEELALLANRKQLTRHKMRQTEGRRTVQGYIGERAGQARTDVSAQCAEELAALPRHERPARLFGTGGYALWQHLLNRPVHQLAQSVYHGKIDGKQVLGDSVRRLVDRAIWGSLSAALNAPVRAVIETRVWEVLDAD